MQLDMQLAGDVCDLVHVRGDLLQLAAKPKGEERFVYRVQILRVDQQILVAGATLVRLRVQTAADQAL